MDLADGSIDPILPLGPIRKKQHGSKARKPSAIIRLLV